MKCDSKKRGDKNKMSVQDDMVSHITFLMNEVDRQRKKERTEFPIRYFGSRCNWKIITLNKALLQFYERPFLAGLQQSTHFCFRFRGQLIILRFELVVVFSLEC